MAVVHAQVTHVLFDMDGLLLNTEDLYTIVYDEILQTYGKSFTWEMKQRMMGRKILEGAQLMIDELELPFTPDDWVKMSKDKMTEVFPSAELLPGVHKLVSHLHRHKIPIAVATSSTKVSFDRKATHHTEFFALFDHIVCAGSDPDVKRGKPAPDVFNVAASRFTGGAPEPSKCLVFEDATLGIQAAKAADMHAVLIPDKRLDLSSVKDIVDQVIGSMEEFVPEEWGLPAYDDDTVGDLCVRAVVRAHITHVLFDMDGLLLNTEELYTTVYNEILQRYGKSFTWEMQQRTMGRKMLEEAQLMIDELDLPFTPDDWVEMTKDKMTEVFPSAELLPGVHKLVSHLHKHNIPIAVATSSSKVSFDLKSTHHKDFFALFDHIVCAGDDPDVKRGKPAPDAFNVAARRFKHGVPEPSKCLVFEDATQGIQAAKAADMHAVLIPDKRLDLSSVKDIVDQVIVSMEEFVPEEWELPAYDDDKAQDSK